MEGVERMIINNIYRSPNSDKINNENINNFLRSIDRLKYDHQIIIGDFNRKDINWKTVTSHLEDDCKFIETIRDSYLTQHILEPTRGRGTDQPSLLDLLFTSNEDSIENIEMYAPLGKSDHSLIKFLYRSFPEKIPEKFVCNYAKADFELMKRKLDINWEMFFQGYTDDINKLWERFVEKYNEADRECIPKKIINTGK